MNFKERAEKLVRNAETVESCDVYDTLVQDIEAFAREIQSETLERVYQIAKADELELISAKQIRALKSGGGES